MDKQLNYNIENTGELMTGSLKTKRTMLIALLLAAVITMVLVAFISYKAFEDRKYNKQVELADKYFAEGNYQQAETEYSIAVDMNKRKPKAREGLAYTYAIQNKTEESVDTYEALYADTNEEKYREAAVDVSEGRLPIDTELSPAKGIWRIVEADAIPYYQTLEDFISFYYLDGGPADDYEAGLSEFKFDINEQIVNQEFETFIGGNPYVFARSIEDIIENEDGEFGTYVKGADPRGWNKENGGYEIDGGYRVYKADETYKLLNIVFNLSGEDVDSMLKTAEENRMAYEQNGDIIWASVMANRIRIWPYEMADIWTDGQRYCVKYETSYNYFEEGEKLNRNMPYDTNYALVEIKKHNNMHYWSLSYFGKEIPKEIDSDLNSIRKEGQEVFGLAFDIIGMTCGEIEDKYGFVSDPRNIEGGIFYETEDGKRVSFNNLLENGLAPSDRCRAFYGGLTDVFNVPDNTNAAELLDLIGVSYNKEQLTYEEDYRQYSNSWVDFVSYKNKEYKVLIDYGENLKVLSVGLVIE